MFLKVLFTTLISLAECDVVAHRLIVYFYLYFLVVFWFIWVVVEIMLEFCSVWWRETYELFILKRDRADRIKGT
jgi:hypothetical protein